MAPLCPEAGALEMVSGIFSALCCSHACSKRISGALTLRSRLLCALLPATSPGVLGKQLDGQATAGDSGGIGSA